MDGEKANDLSKHNRVFGSNVPLGLMNDVMKQFYLKRETEPPMVPLCRLIPTDVVRPAIGDASWLVPLFDQACYVPTMGSFTISLKGRHGETKNVTHEMVERWDPIWQQLNASFERKLVGEWTDLQHKAFFVWDGNHLLKRWMKRIEEVYSENEQCHPLVRCQFIEVDKKKETELILSLDTTNDKWEHFLSEENNKLRGMGLLVDKHKQKMDDAIKRMEEKLRDNGFKYLSIANPFHGEEFFSMLKKDWSDKSMIEITKDELYSLCPTKITIERRKELLHTMILTKAKDPKAMHFADYKKLRFYMRQEAYWQGMFEEATLIITKLQVEGLELPATFDGFFKTSRKLHATQAYNIVLGTMKKASDCATLPEVDKNDENTMFSAKIMERGITPWECSHCPWWLEYPLGVVPKSEEAIHDCEFFFTYVDALLLDIESIDNFAWHYIETWFQRVGSCYENEYHLKGEVLEYVARLIFANFPTSMLLLGVQDSYAADDVEDDIPAWNQISVRLVRGVMDIADVNLADKVKRSYLSELPTRTRSEYTHVDELMVRGGAERTSSFFSWMLATFTDKDDHVLDLFADCGALGDACSKEMQHCLMLEGDFLVFSECLQKKVCGPLDEED
ncbi:hypothetical protein L7F22_017468 [Adiantum nelumboides]|nr:hypothetical protein [Adiantum nelumboides]